MFTAVEQPDGLIKRNSTAMINLTALLKGITKAIILVGQANGGRYLSDLCDGLIYPL